MIKKKGKIIIFSILIILLLFSIIYLKTDILKTKEQLFWKYMSKKVNEITQILSNDEIKLYNNKFKTSSYIKEGQISITTENKFIEPINILINKKGDNIKTNSNTNIEVQYGKNNTTTLSIIKDCNDFFIKSDFLYDEYIRIENNNLKQLAQSFGLSNTGFIPNQIKELDLNEVLFITDEEKTYLLKKYVPICRNIINGKNYSKTSNYITDTGESNIIYQVDISETELNELIAEILKELHNDDISMELIRKKVELFDDKNIYCDIDNIKSKIEELINIYESKETTEKEFASIIIYIKEKNVTKIELMLKNDRTISIQTDNSQNKIIIKQYNVENKRMNIKGVENIAYTILDSITEVTYSKDIINHNENKVDINVIFDFEIEKITFNYNYVEQIKNDVENLLDKNEIKYVDLEKIKQDIYKKIVEKPLRINAFKVGKKY